MRLRPPQLSAMKSIVPVNAFSSVTVQGLVLEDGVSIGQMFHKGVVKPGDHVMIGHEILIRPDGIPPRPKSLLPPPGDMHLEVSLGEKIGSGRVGSVHAVTVLSPNIELPQLVIKVTDPKRSIDMAQEAWFYEELEQLQGISIPRCYGFFQARLKNRHEASTWDKYRDDSDESDDSDDPDTKNKEYEKDVPGQGQLLSILLLERLGSHMPIGQPMEDIEKDVYELYNDLAHYGIESLDIRYDNILSACEEYQDDFAGIICPNHGHVHRWRLVDFDHARKTDGNFFFTDGSNATWLERLFRNLVEGCIIEPWD